jgi:predicted ArsR family transcriptional regulator
VKTARERIIQYLQVKGEATAAEISLVLKTTKANIRHHLLVLTEEGVVEPVGLSPQHQRGRPSEIYALTQNTRSHNLDKLASVLLKQATMDKLPTEYSATLKNLAKQIAGETLQTPSSLTHKFLYAVKRLNEMNYQAQWEAHGEAPRFILGHCPYTAILPEHPELCQLDALMLEYLLGTSVYQTSKLEKGPRGLPLCRFLVKI